jgi:hypothetical protein
MPAFRLWRALVHSEGRDDREQSGVAGHLQAELHQRLQSNRDERGDSANSHPSRQRGLVCCRKPLPRRGR